MRRAQKETLLPLSALLLLGLALTAVSGFENPGADFAGYGFWDWLGFVSLPLSLGWAWSLGIRRFGTESSELAGVRVLLVLGMIAGLFTLLSDRMFEIENRNNVFAGALFVGLAGGGLIPWKEREEAKDRAETEAQAGGRSVGSRFAPDRGVSR